MFVQVKRLRVRGRRMAERQISASEPTDGILKMAGHQWEMAHVLSVLPHNDTLNGSLIPELINPQIMALHNGGMLLAGIERPEGKDGPAFMQEWSIRVINV